MGDIKKQRKKFSKPGHPWNKERILAEQELLKEYGLKRKKEIWKMDSILSGFARQAKELITGEDDIKKGQLLGKLISLGLLKEGSRVEEVLSIELKDILGRRLQTLVFRKKLARSIDQSRQFIVHEHISIGDKKITVPSYMVSVDEENLIQFAQDSDLANPEHSERVIETPKKQASSEKKPAKKTVKKESKKEKPVKKKAAKEKSEESKKKEKEKPSQEEETKEKADQGEKGKEKISQKEDKKEK